MSKQPKVLAEIYDFIDTHKEKLIDAIHQVEDDIDSINVKKKKAKGEEYKRLHIQELELYLVITDLMDGIVELLYFMIALKKNELKVFSTKNMLEI